MDGTRASAGGQTFVRSAVDSNARSWLDWAAGVAGHAGNGPLAVPGAGPIRIAAVHEWVVQPGDTLWSIARHVQPAGDVRPLVDELDAELHGHALEVGQQLTIP
jgi:LysM repeat protein